MDIVYDISIWFINKFYKFLKWLFDFSGLRFIYYKINPPRKKVTDNPRYTPPITITLWILGVYVAFYGIASQRYENRIDIIENRANSIFAQLSTPAYKKALSRISRVQNMPCPQKPFFLKPTTTIKSLFGKDTTHNEIVETLKETLENWKDSLDSVNLANANLQKANLADSNLFEANLKGANLQHAILVKADLKHANLENANLQYAELWKADLSNANVYKTNFSGSWLEYAKFDALGMNTDRLKAIAIQLSKSKTLYRTKFDGVYHSIQKVLERDRPNLFVEPVPKPYNLKIKSGEVRPFKFSIPK